MQLNVVNWIWTVYLANQESIRDPIKLMEIPHYQTSMRGKTLIHVPS